MYEEVEKTVSRQNIRLKEWQVKEMASQENGKIMAFEMLMKSVFFFKS